MGDRTKFEQMLEFLINDEKSKAEELFHEIVVEKSREIYENILDDELALEADEEGEEESTEEAAEEEEESVEEMFNMEADDEEEGDAPDFGGDDEEGDAPDMDGDDEPADDDVASMVLDVKDDLQDLKDMFAALDAKIGGGDDMDMGMDGDVGGPGDAGDDFVQDVEKKPEDEMFSFEADDEEEEPKTESKKFRSPGDLMREYVDKVASPSNKEGADNTKSIIDNMKNDMGGTNQNIVSGRDGADAGSVGAGGTIKGNGVLKGKPQDMNTGNINVPGGNAGKTAFTHKEPGHGPEKKGAGENADKGAGSPLNGAPGRAK